MRHCRPHEEGRWVRHLVSRPFINTVYELRFAAVNVSLYLLHRIAWMQS